jgi:hypothetical protein
LPRLRARHRSVESTPGDTPSNPQPRVEQRDKRVVRVDGIDTVSGATNRAGSEPCGPADPRERSRRRQRWPARSAPNATRMRPSSIDGWPARSTYRASRDSSTNGQPVMSRPASGECASTASTVTMSPEVLSDGLSTGIAL